MNSSRAHAQAHPKRSLFENSFRTDKGPNKQKFPTRKFRLFAGTGHPELAKAVAEELGVPLGQADVGEFADGEIKIQIQENVRGRDIFIVQPTGPPINDNLMELLLMISTFRRASARSITAIIPYFGYARQDRIRDERQTVAAADVALMLEAAGVDRVVAVDLHRGQLEGFFTCSTRVDNLDSLRAGAQRFISEDLENPVIVCPSISGVSRAKRFRDLLEHEGVYTSLAFVSPTDDSGIMDAEAGHHHKMAGRTKYVLVGSVRHCDVVIVDDMIDTGSRITTAAEVIKEKGANRVFAYASHGLFSGDCLDMVNDSPISRVVVSDTLPDSKSESKQSTASDSKIERIPVAPLIAEAIQRIALNQPATILTSKN